jgi:hypothetical protein
MVIARLRSAHREQIMLLGDDVQSKAAGDMFFNPKWFCPVAMMLQS